MLENIKITRKLPLIMISFALISSLTTGAIAYINAVEQIEISAKNRLSSLLESRKSALENYFDTIEKDLNFHVKSPLIIDALTQMNDAFYAASNKPNDYLRHLYIDKNPFPSEQKDAFLDAKDGSLYSQLHNQYHPTLRNLAVTSDFHDLFLISPQGDLIYTVNKEIDFGTNLLTGLWKDTNLSTVFKEIKNQKTQRKYVFKDFSNYEPSGNIPASFMGSAVLDFEGKYIGALVFQMPIKLLNNVMQVTAGMGESGETYIVGKDNLMRSDSRFLQGRSILKTTVDTQSTQQALIGLSGVNVIKDYRNISVFSAYTPIDFYDARWAVIAEIDEEEMMHPVHAMSQFLMIAASIITFTIFIVGLVLAFDLSNPIRTMTRAMIRLTENKLDTNISVSGRQDEVGDMAHALVIFKKNAEEKEILHKKLNYIAHHDSLTGLPTRKYLMDHLSDSITKAADQKLQIILMFIDLDNFKTVNDTLGHEAGDILLKEVANRFSQCIRKGDIIARLGGDEFVILLPNINSIHDGYAIASKIKTAMSQRFEFLGEIKTGASIGFVIYPEHGINSHELLSAADRAMYVAKNNGGNNSFSPEI